MTITWDAFGSTDPGRIRAGNEDAFRVDPEHGVFLVADGMGGHAAGEVASALVAKTAAEVLTRAVEGNGYEARFRDGLAEATRMAHDAIVTCCADDPRTRGMGTTLTACVLHPSGRLGVAHIGDSRLYRLRAEELEQLTVDHTWVQREVAAGRLGAEAARHHHLAHILTRVLSAESDYEADLLDERALPGDLLLLATDGLYNMLGDEEIARVLSSGAGLRSMADALIRAANAAGGVDNITVVLIRVNDSDVTAL